MDGSLSYIFHYRILHTYTNTERTYLISVLTLTLQQALVCTDTAGQRHTYIHTVLSNTIALHILCSRVCMCVCEAQPFFRSYCFPCWAYSQPIPELMYIYNFSRLPQLYFTCMSVRARSTASHNCEFKALPTPSADRQPFNMVN